MRHVTSFIIPHPLLFLSPLISPQPCNPRAPQPCFSSSSSIAYPVTPSPCLAFHLLLTAFSSLSVSLFFYT